jgi:hypothetical protein
MVHPDRQWAGTFMKKLKTIFLKIEPALKKRLPGTWTAFRVSYCVMLVVGLFSQSAADTLWTQAIRFPGYNAFGHHCRETVDGGILMTGYALSIDTANPGDKGFLLKTSGTGEIQWKVLYDDTVMMWGTSIIKADDNGYFISGISGRTGEASYDSCDGVIIETDPQGAVKRRMVFDQGGWDAADFSISTPDNGMAVVGLTKTGDPLSVNGWIFKTDQNGLVQWSNVIGDTNWDVCFDICRTNDNGYSATGYTESTDSLSQLDIWLIRLDSSGGIKWKRIYDGSSPSSTEIAYAVAQTADRGFIVAGFCAETKKDVFVMRTDSIGGVLWEKKYGKEQDEEATSLIAMPDGGFLVAGTVSSLVDTTVTSDIWILRLDSNGDTLWTRTYGSVWNDYVERLTPASNGCCLIAGSTRLSGEGERDAWLLKFSPDEAKAHRDPNKRTLTPSAQTIRKVYVEKTISKSCSGAYGSPAKVAEIFDMRGRSLSRFAKNNAAGLYISRSVSR